MRTVDVAVIGGGPAGATLATVCAQNGLDVALYEREMGPRYRVGESLLPATPRQLAPLLGAADKIEEAGFVVKPGATFCWGDRPDTPWSLFFRVPGAVGENLPALNVDRQRFDAILLENATAQGVDVRKGHRVLSVGDGDAVQGRVVEVRVPDNGERHRIRARYVVNASGQIRLNLPEIRARTHSRFFRKVAVWGYWDGAGRLGHPLEGNVFFETLETGYGSAWAWFIPLSDTLTSVGVVAPRACASTIRKNGRGVLKGWLAQCPRTSALLADARPSTGRPYREVRLCADYSYASDMFWAPGLAQVGDAACFVDVLLSSGVHLATYGALLAARSISAVLRDRLPETLAMAEYESRVRQEFAVFYAGLTGLYDTTRPRNDYIDSLRKTLGRSNGVAMEWNRCCDAPGRPDPGSAALRGFDREALATSNVQTMRAFNRGQLDYCGPPRIVPVNELPAIQNALTVVPGRRGWQIADARG